MSQQELQSFFQEQLEEVQQHSLDVTEFTKNHQLPLARIKKIMKSDEDVRMISAEAPVLFAKACEIFILELTLKAWRHAEENKRRTLQRNDVSAAIARTDIFDFLLDVVPKEDLRPENPENGGQQMMPGFPGMPQGGMMPQGMFPFPPFTMPPGSEAFFQGMQMPNMQMPGMQAGGSQPAQMPGMTPQGNNPQQGGGAQQATNPADMLQFWQQQMSSLQQSFQQPQQQQQQQQPQQQPGQQASSQAPFGSNNMAPGSAPMDPALMMSFFASLGQQGQQQFPFFPPPASGS